MKKNLIMIFLFAIVVNTAYGQINYFIEAGINKPFIPTSEASGYIQNPTSLPGYSSYIPQSYNVEESFDRRPGFDISLGVRKQFTNRLSLETGIGASMLFFDRKVQLNYDFEQHPVVPDDQDILPGQSIGSMYGDIKFTDLGGDDDYEPTVLGSPDGKTNIFYLTVPLNINYSLLKNRLEIGGGVSASILARSVQHRHTLVMRENSSEGVSIPNPWSVDDPIYNPKVVPGVEEIEDKSGDGLTNVIWNGNVFVQYRILKNAWINLAYQHSFTPMYEDESRLAGDAKVRLAKLGIRYYLFSN